MMSVIEPSCAARIWRRSFWFRELRECENLCSLTRVCMNVEEKGKKSLLRSSDTVDDPASGESYRPRSCDTTAHCVHALPSSAQSLSNQLLHLTLFLFLQADSSTIRRDLLIIHTAGSLVCGASRVTFPELSCTVSCTHPFNSPSNNAQKRCR